MTRSIENWHHSYDPATFAEKYGLTLNQAKIIIGANGPSKHGCDVGAMAFLQALKMRDRRPVRRRAGTSRDGSAPA
jgi:hypothetical protein